MDYSGSFTEHYILYSRMWNIFLQQVVKQRLSSHVELRAQTDELFYTPPISPHEAQSEVVRCSVFNKQAWL